MIEDKVFKELINKLQEKYDIYEQSLHIKNSRLFFLLKNKDKKLFGEANFDNSFTIKDEIIDCFNIEINNKIVYLKIFNTTKINSKRIAELFKNLIPVPINKKTSVGFGDRIGIASSFHSEISKNYDFFPVFAQQSVREILMTGKTCEDVFHNAVIGIFQSGFDRNWGADADHIRDIKWLKIMLDNNYMPYTMFTIDTYDHIIPDNSESFNNFKEDVEFKQRYEKAKRYIGKEYKIPGYRLIYSEDNIYNIVKRYYKSLSFLLNCYNFIKEKIDSFDFEPTFDERDIDTTPEEHFYLVSEMINDGIVFTTFAPKFFGIFEKGIDYIGDIDEFKKQLKAHNEIVKNFGTYRISLHSADDKFRVFEPFKEIIGNNCHIKTSGTTWMESLRTIAQIDASLFQSIVSTTLEKAENNSAAYHINLDYNKIKKSFELKNLEELIDIKETRQLLHVSYGTILEKYRNNILELLLLNENKYAENVKRNYKKHFSALLPLD